MKKLNAKLSIPKLKAIHHYQQIKNIKREQTDPTNATQNTSTGIILGW